MKERMRRPGKLLKNLCNFSVSQEFFLMIFLHSFFVTWFDAVDDVRLGNFGGIFRFNWFSITGRVEKLMRPD
jgi:hypothetical protein